MRSNLSIIGSINFLSNRVGYVALIVNMHNELYRLYKETVMIYFKMAFLNRTCRTYMIKECQSFFYGNRLLQSYLNCSRIVSAILLSCYHDFFGIGKVKQGYKNRRSYITHFSIAYRM